MILHLARMGGITALIVLGTVYPFLPGSYDSLALAISTMAQVFGMIGLLLVPVGAVWLAYEVRKQARIKQNLPTQARRYAFALVALIAATLVGLVMALVAFATVGLSLALLTAALWLYVSVRFAKNLKRLREAEAAQFNFAPFYLMVIPLAVLLFQLALAAPVTVFSRNLAIRNSAEFINAIEAHHARHGYYPSSLAAVYNDYAVSVSGIQNFHYASNGEAYNLYFEQPRFLLDNIGTREFVVYNPLDEQFMISHNSWILLLTPEELETAQGWYAVNEASTPHWKYFWFD